MTQQIVINTCYGGFGLSETAQLKYLELSGSQVPEASWELQRDDPHLVQTVLDLGQAASGTYAKLKVVVIPSDVVWHIEEYDGQEWIAENHRTWK